jgi:hypothetical protein
MSLQIQEIKNPNQFKMKPIKEKQDIYIPEIKDENISKRNGMIYCLTGSGGSGKSSLLLNMFRDKNYYRGKFNNIYLFTPISSFLSVENHPFKNHDKVYHELTVLHLDNLYNQMVAMREGHEDYLEKKKKNKKNKNKTVVDGYGDIISEDEEDEENKEIQYNCIIIDDFADALKDNDIMKQLNKMLIKARHICCSFIFTLQTYYYFPKSARKQITYLTMFKSKNVEEFNSIAKELFNMNKDDALQLFNYVFNEPYTHLDIDLVNNIYYKNFNKLIIN